MDEEQRARLAKALGDHRRTQHAMGGCYVVSLALIVLAIILGWMFFR
jgi:hypothetical protein